MLLDRLTRIVCLLLIAVILVGCSRTETTEETQAAPEISGVAVNSGEDMTNLQAALGSIQALGTAPDDNYRTWYEIFVYSFCDSDGDGIGDLKGVTSKLDYLQELGVNGIWLMPIHPSPSYHKYDVTDYYAIDPAYGTMEDFDAFMAECEKRDVHVILDLVVNHTSSEHPWFTAAYSYLQNLPEGAEPDVSECKYLDYYHFTTEPPATWYCPVAGTNWSYEGKFWEGMPDLELENPDVQSEIRDIMAFWLDKGVSGFRLDAAKEYYSGENPRNVEVLSFLQETLVSLKPDGYMVAEVWDSVGAITEYYSSGISSIFNFPFGESSGRIIKNIRGIGNPDTAKGYAEALERCDDYFREANPDYIDAPFLSNHDTGRIAGFCSRDENKMKLAGAMNLLMSGSAFVYYGEELGMLGSGNDPSKRAPMVWNEARDSGTTNPPPECELPESYPLGSLETQRDDAYSIYNYYRQAIAIRQSLSVIARGRTTAETALNTGCISAQRKTAGEDTCLILMNLDTEAASVDLTAYAGYRLAASLDVGAEKTNLESTTLNMMPYGIAILIP